MELQNSSSDSEDKVQVKTEPQEEDIKDYAEDTMNELLAIYGYEKVDEGVTKELQLHHFSDEKEKRERKRSCGNIIIKEEKEEEVCYDMTPLQPNSDHEFSGPSSPIDDHMCTNNSCAPASTCTSAECSDGENLPAEYEIICAWCQHFGYKRYTLNTTTESKAFCSEKCFAACRRAYFKRSKVCDWCRHIRHTKEYVEFQDGERKLQFCSEKCLNQYKMDVFCRETQVLGSSSGLSVIESGSAIDTSLSEHGGVGAGNSSDETEVGEGNPMLNVVDESSTQPCGPGNGVHNTPPSTQSQDSPLVASQRKPKLKLISNTTSIGGVKHVSIAPKVNTESQPSPKINQVGVGPVAANVTPTRAFSTRVNPANPTGQVVGLQTIIQPGVGNSQLVARAPVVVRGTHWPPVVRQIPSYVIPGQQQVTPPQLILPVRTPKKQQLSTPVTTRSPECSTLPQSSFGVKSHDKEQSSTCNSCHLLPPVTVMVPQPIFIPIPYPVPIPIPVQSETFHAMRKAYSASPNEASPSMHMTSPNRIQTSSTSSKFPRYTSSSLDVHVRPRKYPATVFPESSLLEQTDQDMMFADSHRVSKGNHEQHTDSTSADCSMVKDPTGYLDVKHSVWQPFFKYKTLQRSTSMDLSLARPEETSSKSIHKSSRSRDPDITMISRSSGNISANQESCFRPDVAVHLSGESSAKVREALRCHLTKRLSQSALNLTEVGRMSNLQDDLRRCQSLSRLRYTESNHMENLPELTDGHSSPTYSSASSNHLERRNVNTHKTEDVDENNHDTKTQAIESDEDANEPDSKRACLNHV